MKKFAFLLLVLIFQLNFGQKNKNFNSKITSPKVEGCLNEYYGQWPEYTFTPTCSGLEEEIHLANLYGHYAKVEVTAGVEYTFITYPHNLSASPAFVTISDEAGTIAYASGDGTVTWTATQNEIVRFYAHVDNQCHTSNDLVKKYIKCGNPPAEPTYGCDQTYTGALYVGSSASELGEYAIADDFFVPKESEAFRLKTLKYLVLPLAGEDDMKTFSIRLLADNNSTPGEVITSYQNLTATSIERNDEDFGGFATYWVTLTIPNGGLEIPVNKDNSTRYWISLQALTETENIFIPNFHRIKGWATAPNHQSFDNGATWSTTEYLESPGIESVWSFDSDCSLLGVNDMETEKISFYPNPVNDILNISTKKQIKDISILSISGQKLLSIAQPKNQQVNVSSLLSGTYLVNVKLENGNMQTFKMIKK